ncbi:S-layer homology domain-containing protein [Intestinimonas butyriciproducens]|uniref:S-layer homology domain-containing protein n=1 Tax=Intestinimonas butyriciproducens TaxID=1297617 RepID=UPI00068C36EE|nr:S-layer homology domain-containing protein [Intestinimonas butyriciproducens]
MIKYQQKWYCKALAMFLAFAILIAAPFSTVQAYATEGDQLTESVDLDDASPDTITEADDGVVKDAPLETSGVTDSGRPPEVPASPTDAAPAGVGIFEADTTPPVFAEGGSPKNIPQPPGSRQIYIYFTAQEPSYYHAVLLENNATPPSKEQVVAGTDSDDHAAIRVFSNKSKETNMTIVGFVSQHSTDYDVYVVLKDDTGNLSEPAMVDFPSPPPADLLASGYPVAGAARPDGSKQVEVKVSLQNIGDGYKGMVYWVLLPQDAARPSIEQVAAGTDGDDAAAIASGNPEFSPGSEESFLVTGAAGNTQYDLYMVVGDTNYANPLGRCTDVIELNVTTPVDIEGEKLCETGGTEYATLQEAVENADSTATIKLLKSFTTVQGVIIDRKHITFDLNGQTLTVDTTANEGLKVTEGIVALTGTGELNVSGKLYGVWVNKGTVTVDTAASGNDGIGVYAMGGSKVTVRGNVTGQNNGVYATDSGTMVTINGDVSNSAPINGAVYSAGQADVTVKGNVTSARGYGVHTYNGKITVDKNVSGNHVGAMSEDNGSEIHIKGNLSSDNNGAVIDSGNGSITVDGEIISPRSYVRIGSKDIPKSEGAADPENSDYLKYSDSGSEGVVWVKSPPAATVWEVGDATELENALNNFKDVDTIQLTRNIDYNKGIVIDGKTVAFDVGNFRLNISNDTGSAAGVGLSVINGGHVNLIGTGQLNVTQTGGNTSTGVRVEAGSSATVTNIRVTVESGSAFGAYADGTGADIRVLGDITVIGEGGCGARTWGRGKITIDGTVTAAIYINIGTTNKTKDSGVEDSTRPDYLKYSTPPNETGIVWVKAAPSAGDYYFEIDGQQYETLEAALGYLENGDTIKLLKSYTHLAPLEIVGKRFTIDLNNNNFNIKIINGTALKVGEASLQITGQGEFNVEGGQYGVWATTGGYVTVTNATALNSSDGIGVYAENGAQVTVFRNVGAKIGAHAIGDDSQITIQGAIIGNEAETYVKVGYDLMPESWGAFQDAATDYLVYTDGEAIISVKTPPDVPERNCAIRNFRNKGFDLLYSELDAALGTAREGAQIRVEILKDIHHTKTIRSRGCSWIFALNGHTLNVVSPDETGLSADKSIVTEGAGAFHVTGKDYGVVASNYAHVFVTSATATGSNPGIGVYASGRATVTVQGNVVGKGSGIKIAGSNEVTVGGSVYADTNSGIGVDVSGSGGGTIIVEGGIHAASDKYLKLTADTLLSKESGISSHGDADKAGYLKYADNEKFPSFALWVKNATFYTLTVESGIGSGSYTAGAMVNIQANSPIPGKVFDKWTTSGGGSFEDVNSVSTTFTMPSNAVTVMATYKDAPTATYLLTVVSGTGGGTYAAGAQVPITANPPAQGKAFDKWTTSNGGSFEDANSASTTFTMPSGAVTVTATYKDVPMETYTLTVSGSYAGTSGAGQYAPGAQVSIHAGSRSNYSFAGWTTSGDGSFANADSISTTFIMPNGNATVIANWTYNGGDSGSSDSDTSGGSASGGSSSNGTNATILPDKKPDQPVIAGFSLAPAVNSSGHATVTISQQSVEDAIAKALADAKAQGKTANGIGISLNIDLPDKAKSLGIVLPQATLQSLVSAGVRQLEINGVIVSLDLDLDALKEIQRQSTGDVTITIKPVQNLSAAAKKLIGARPVYDVSVSYVKDGKTVNITSLGKGGATLSLPYKPGKNEAVGWLFGVYVDGKGNPTRISGSAYDAGSGSVILDSGHFSIYGVGYTAPTEKYTDIASHWAKESIDYAVGRGLFSGTTDTNFSPNTAMDRGMLVTVLGRLAGADVSVYKTSSFTDVATGTYYLPYVEWAYKKGIVSGIGNGKFAPERAVTREEIALILQNYAKATGYTLPVTREAITFADNSSISSTYASAIRAMQQAGIMVGGSGNKFNPKAGATRAEVAAMLHRYVKLTIDPATAQGWALNDDGRYLYYKDGKPLTGWQTIDGVKYYFNSAGVLQTGWVKDGSNWRYYSGNKALTGWWDIGSTTYKKRYYFDKNGVMVYGKWLQIDKKWYYFYTDGSLARSTTIDGYEVDENGVRKSK